MRHRRPRGKGPAFVDPDVSLPRKSSKTKGRRQTGKNADPKATNKRSSAAAVAADTSVEAAVAKATNVTGKAAKAAAEKAAKAEKSTSEDADDYGKMDDVGPNAIKKKETGRRRGGSQGRQSGSKGPKRCLKSGINGRHRLKSNFGRRCC